MDDRRLSSAHRSPSAALLVPLRRCAACLAIASAVWTLGGCSLFVMAGKMFFGDPKQTAAFRATTDVDLTDGDKSVLIVATTPQGVKAETSNVDLEVVERVSRLLRTKGVKVYPSKQVLNWLDERGGQWGDPNEIAEKFDADYIVEIDIDRFTHLEENSPDLYRGNALGNVRAYEVVKSDGRRVASPCFAKEFTCTYPSHAPKAAHSISEDVFRQEFLNRVCDKIAQQFCDHRASETVY
jgi:hypothetical protein